MSDFLMATKKGRAIGGLLEKKKWDYLPQYDSFMGMRDGIGGLLKMLLAPQHFPPFWELASRVSEGYQTFNFVGCSAATLFGGRSTVPT